MGVIGADRSCYSSMIESRSLEREGFGYQAAEIDAAGETGTAVTADTDVDTCNDCTVTELLESLSASQSEPEPKSDPDPSPDSESGSKDQPISTSLDRSDDRLSVSLAVQPDRDPNMPGLESLGLGLKFDPEVLSFVEALPLSE